MHINSNKILNFSRHLKVDIQNINSTSEETSRYLSIYQTSVRPSQSSITQDYPQFDHANPGSNLRNLPGMSLHSSSFILQEPNGENRGRLGSPSSFRPSQQGRAQLVVLQPAEMERSVPSNSYTRIDYLCRCQRHGLGLQLGQATSTWLLDPSRSSRVDQLARTQGSPFDSQDFPDTGEFDYSDQDRQHNQSIIY
jgi:hypothetical protein